MDRDLLIRKNNLEVNKVAAKCLRITILFLISLGMFSVTDYYNYDTPSVIITFAGSIVFYPLYFCCLHLYLIILLC